MIFRKVSLAVALALLCVTFTACEKPEEKEARYLKRGNALFEQGDYVKARLEYKNAEQIMPTDAEPRYRLGLVDEEEGDPRNAFANYIGAEQQNTHYHPALLKLAQYFIAIEEYAQADRRLTIVLGETPDDAEGHALRASILLRQKDFDGTEKEARIALKDDPANLTAISVLTGLYSAQKDEAKAIAILDEGIARNPKELSLLLLKVMLYGQSSNVDKIAQAYHAIFTLKPMDETYRVGLANIYVKAGKLDDAEATLRDGVAVMPGDWTMKKDLVVFLGDNRSLETAENEIRGLMKANPNNNDLYFWLADLYISHNATDRAVALLEQIISKDESDHTGLNARTSLARIQFVKGNRILSEKLVAAVLEKDSGNADALFIRAQMSFDQGHYQEAVSDLRTIIRDQPQSVGAVQLLAETLLLQGHLDLAIDTLNQLVDNDPGNMAAVIRLAQMYMLNGNSGQGMNLLAIVTKTEPNDALGWESTARAALSIKDWKTAQEAITRLDALQGQHMIAVYLQGQLLDDTGKAQEALPLYAQVFKADPSSPLAEHALSSFVDVKQKLGQLLDAVETLRSLKADTPFISTLLGGCLVKLGKTTEAAAAFDKAIAENPASQDPYIGRAELYQKDNRPDEALDVLNKAREAIPSDIRAPMMAATIFIKLDRYQEAVALYDDILTHNPGMDTAANDMAEVIADYEYTDTAAMEKARQAAERFAGSTNPLYLDTLGWVYYRQGNLQQAQTVMERVMGYKDLPPEVHYHYASLLLKLGKTEEAKAELTRATAEGADYSGLEDAKKIKGGI